MMTRAFVQAAGKKPWFEFFFPKRPMLSTMIANQQSTLKAQKCELSYAPDAQLGASEVPVTSFPTSAKKELGVTAHGGSGGLLCGSCGS